MPERFPHRRRRVESVIVADAPLDTSVAVLRLSAYTARLVDGLGVATAVQLANVPAAELIRSKFRPERIAELREEILRVGLVPPSDWLTTVERRRKPRARPVAA